MNGMPVTRPALLRPSLLAFVADQPLVDHHCHGVLRPGRALDAAELAGLLNEADGTAVADGLPFDSLAGLALRRWCPPVLGLAPHAEVAAYAERRAALGADEVSRRFLGACGITALCVDSGYAPAGLLSAAETAGLAGAPAFEIVRLEQVAESLAGDGVSAAGFPDAYRRALGERVAAPASGVRVVGFKSIAAYRVGLELDGRRPDDREVAAAVSRWLGGGGLADKAVPRLADEVLHRFFIWCAAELGLPIQFHVGYGDRDIDLHKGNPLLLTGLLRSLEPTGAPVMLLHNYPYHREAGYLAQVFPHVYADLGLATHNVGGRATALLGEALELVPLRKFLFSSDAFGLPELYYLGTVLFRRALSSFLSDRLADDDMSYADAERVTRLIGSENARRVYRLSLDAAGGGDVRRGGLAGGGGGDARALELRDVDVGGAGGRGGAVQLGQVLRPALVVGQQRVELCLQVGADVAGDKAGRERSPADQAAAAHALGLRVALGLLVDVARDAGRGVVAVAVREQEADDRGHVRREQAAAQVAAQRARRLACAGGRGRARGRGLGGRRGGRRLGVRGRGRGLGRRLDGRLDSRLDGCRRLGGRRLYRVRLGHLDEHRPAAGRTGGGDHGAGDRADPGRHRVAQLGRMRRVAAYQ